MNEASETLFLSEQQRMIRDMARSFAERELAPNAPTWDRDATFPAAAVREMGRLGLMGMLVPEGYDGAGADHLAYALAMEEIAAGDASCSTIMSVNNSLCCAPILNFGTPEQKERFLRPLAKGEIHGAFCLTEPEAGSDAAGIRTRALAGNEGWVLNGTKQFISSGATAGLAVVFAVTDAAAGKKGISAFLVPTDLPGYRVVRHETKLGQRASDTCQIVFEDLALGHELVLGRPGEGYRIALSTLEGGRIGIGAQSVGIARAALDAAVAYANERETFGRRIIEHQAVGFRLADMATALEAARLMVHRAARLKDAGIACLKEASMAKLFAAEAAERICSDAIQVFGGYGYLTDFPVERLWRDARVCRIYEGTSDIQRLLIARTLRAG